MNQLIECAFPKSEDTTAGLSKQEYTIIKLAAGLLANPHTRSDTDAEIKEINEKARKLARIILTDSRD